jgi:uncharacterized protein (TIGR03435 family)
MARNFAHFGIGFRRTVRPAAVALTAPSATLASLVELMSRFTARPVVDMTGIEGQYEFNLNFARKRARARPLAESQGRTALQHRWNPHPQWLTL